MCVPIKPNDHILASRREKLARKCDKQLHNQLGDGARDKLDFYSSQNIHNDSINGIFRLFLFRFFISIMQLVHLMLTFFASSSVEKKSRNFVCCQSTQQKRLWRLRRENKNEPHPQKQWKINQYHAEDELRINKFTLQSMNDSKKRLANVRVGKCQRNTQKIN